MPSKWQDEQTDAQVVRAFQNAIVHALDECLGTARRYDYDIETKFAIVHGSPYGASGIREVLYGAKSRREIALALEDLLTAASDTPTPYGGVGKVVDSVALALEQALQHHPRINLRLVHIGESYELHPAGAEEIDERAVERTLAWLATYPAVREHARKTLTSLAEEDTFESLNSARLALETFLRAVLGNSKSLENQVANDPNSSVPLARWLRDKGVKPQTATMALRIISSFCDLQNSWVKHPPETGSTFERTEAEFAMYITFSLMRLVSQLA